jgi:hypothetical protein
LKRRQATTGRLNIPSRLIYMAPDADISGAEFDELMSILTSYSIEQIEKIADGNDVSTRYLIKCDRISVKACDRKSKTLSNYSHANHINTANYCNGCRTPVLAAVPPKTTQPEPYRGERGEEYKHQS